MAVKLPSTWQKKWSVVVAEMLPTVASDLQEANQEMLVGLLKEYKVEVFTQALVKKVTPNPNKVFITTPDGDRSFVTDLIVLAVGSQPVNNLAKMAEGLVEEVRVVGDCVSPRKIKDAIWDAFKGARMV